MAACRIILTNNWAELPTEHHQRCSKLVCSTSEARQGLVISLISPYQPSPLPSLPVTPWIPPRSWCHQSPEVLADWTILSSRWTLKQILIGIFLISPPANMLSYSRRLHPLYYHTVSAVFSMQHINDLTSGILSRLFLTLDDCDEDVESWRYDTFIFR